MGGAYSFGARMLVRDDHVQDGLHDRWQEGRGFGLILPGRVKAARAPGSGRGRAYGRHRLSFSQVTQPESSAETFELLTQDLCRLLWERRGDADSSS
jgi:hypothetical protein